MVKKMNQSHSANITEEYNASRKGNKMTQTTERRHPQTVSNICASCKIRISTWGLIEPCFVQGFLGVFVLIFTFFFVIWVAAALNAHIRSWPVWKELRNPPSTVESSRCHYSYQINI